MQAYDPNDARPDAIEEHALQPPPQLHAVGREAAWNAQRRTSAARADQQDAHLVGDARVLREMLHDREARTM